MKKKAATTICCAILIVAAFLSCTKRDAGTAQAPSNEPPAASEAAPAEPIATQNVSQLAPVSKTKQIAKALPKSAAAPSPSQSALQSQPVVAEPEPSAAVAARAVEPAKEPEPEPRPAARAAEPEPVPPAKPEPLPVVRKSETESEAAETAVAARPVEPARPPEVPPAPSFSNEKERGAFEEAIVKGDFSAVGNGTNAAVSDQYAAIEIWAKAVQEARELDAAIERLSVEAEKENAPPQISFALAALYGRKGLIQKQYAALVKTEAAVKARPDVVFALSAVYGRKDTLKAKYKADDLLVGSLSVESEPSEAKVFVDGESKGRSPLNLAKIKEGKHRLRVEYSGYDAWEVPFEVVTGRETKLSARLGAKPGSVEVLVTPKVGVCLDEGSLEDTPHLFEGLAPGEHKLYFTGLLVNKRYYLDDPDARVTVLPGQKAVYKKDLQIGRTKLQVLSATKGSSLFLDGQRLPDPAVQAATQGEGYDMEAGAYELKIVSPSGQSWYSSCLLIPNSPNTYMPFQMGVILAKRTVKLDGKRDSWGDLEPLIDTPMKGSGVLAGYNISKIYACRDDKFVYWRFDFDGSSPFSQHPKKIEKAVVLQISIQYESRKQLNAGIKYNKQSGMNECYFGIYNSESKNWTDMGNAAGFKSSKDMLVVRVSTIGLGSYFKNPCRVDYGFTQELKSGGWDDKITQWRNGRIIDFAQGAAPEVETAPSKAVRPRG
jgi:hypothetical protein